MLLAPLMMGCSGDSSFLTSVFQPLSNFDNRRSKQLCNILLATFVVMLCVASDEPSITFGPSVREAWQCETGNGTRCSVM